MGNRPTICGCLGYDRSRVASRSGRERISSVQEPAQGASRLVVELNALSLLAEDQWFKVSNGRMYDDDIHDLRIALKKKKASAVQKAFPVAGLPENKKLADKAEFDNAQYFSSSM
jgi:hypothetical protein